MAAGEDENFSDDEWDVPDEDLQILEQNAISSTQQQQPVEWNETRQRGTLSLQNPEHGTGTSAGRIQSRPQILNRNGFSEHGLYEKNTSLLPEEKHAFVPRRAVDETTQREQWRLNRFAQESPGLQPPRQTFPQRNEVTHGRPLQHQFGGQARDSFENIDAIEASNNADQGLRSILEEMKRERDLLTQNLDNATRELRTAKGEIAVIRDNKDRESRTFERQMNLLKKQMQDETGKHHATLRTRDEEHNQLVTNHSFLKHELDEQKQKIQHLQRQLKEKPTSERSRDVNLTPRKGPFTSINDGFNVNEMSFVSPTKSPAKSGKKSKQATPTNRKRKQLANETDIQPLSLRLSGAAEQIDFEEPSPKLQPQKPQQVIRRDSKTERHLRLVQALLNFRPLGGHQPLLERFVTFSFPTDTSRSLSSLVSTSLASLKGDRLSGDLIEIFISLWIRALKEKYHKPISILIEVINYLFDCEPTIIDKEILNKLVPLLTDTADINATTRFLLADRSKIWNGSKHRKPQFDPDVDSHACLDLLYTIACLVADENDLLVHFWRLVKTDHVLLTLSSSQPVPAISLMLQILSTSIMPVTFGNICGSPEEQLKMETYITDRICFLLWENMKQVDESQQPYTRAEVSKLRLEALNLLSQFAVSSSPHPHKNDIENHHGTMFMVNHPTAIARLVRSVYDEVDNMYSLYPTHELHAQLVNRAMSILHHLLTSPQAEHINLSVKLQGTPVGEHKFRVVLTRLAFREGTFLDKGITEETMHKATEILEDHVTPDEAVAFLEAFGKSPDMSGRMEE